LAATRCLRSDSVELGSATVIRARTVPKEVWQYAKRESVRVGAGEPVHGTYLPS
jgi:hypothetical protein